jgi:hypothetical protein
LKPKRFRLLNWLLIAALTITLAPFSPAKTEAAPVPSNFFQFRDFSIDSSFPTDVNSNLVDVIGTFNDVTPSTIIYKVEQITISGGVTTVVQSNIGTTQPVLSGQNYNFAGVSLYSGLNRITVQGTSTSGNVVSGVSFINFSNNPAISELKLTDGRDLLLANSAVITTNSNDGITVKAPNATGVSINGIEMIGGANSSFFLTNLGLARGSNKLTIIARNASKTYEITRQLVYYDGTLTAYDMKIGTTSLDGNPRVMRTDALTGTVTAKVIVPTSVTPTITFSIPLTPTDWTETVTTATYSGGAATYRIFDVAVTTPASNQPSISQTGSYNLVVTDTSPTPDSTFNAPFSFRDTDAAFINDIKQAYGVTVGATSGGRTPITNTSFGSFLNNGNVSQVPLWLYLDTSNFNASLAGHTVTINASQNGVPLSNTQFVATTTYTTGTGLNANKWPAIQITKMPAGVIDLTITINDGANTDTIKRKITFLPVPSIQLDSVWDGKKYEADFTSTDLITGKLINFDLNNNPELNTLTLSLNGVEYPLIRADDGGSFTGPTRLANPQGGFSFNPTSSPVGNLALHLVLGPNTLVFKGVAGGIPVSTSITVYYFSKNNPSVSTLRSVPNVLDPALRVFNDINTKFASTGTRKVSTTETKMDLLFDVKSVTDIEVRVDGIPVASVSTSGTTMTATDLKSTDTISLYFEDGSSTLKASITSAATNTLRVMGVQLPKSGETNISIIVKAGAGEIMETLTVVRELAPYILLSPRLPEEAVMNSNFLKVSIKAEGADQVLLGKAVMVKGQGDIFRYEVQNLKAGNNTISFTVMTGTQKINGKFSVNYAADNSLSAQYKSTIAKSGKLSMFKGDLSVTFPKNTFLRQANVNPGQDVQTADLFDSQGLYFGIADRTDGRTVKKYNAVGEQDVYNNYLDGTILNVMVNTDAVNYLRPQANFAYSSNLYWVDAGYYKAPVPPSSTFTMEPAKSPYAAGADMFYLRATDPNKWLEPSQRGTISIKYDPDVRDALATNLTIWRYTGQRWQNIGGVVNTKNKTVTAPLDGFGYYTVMSLRYSYSDIQTHSYARTAMETMYAKNIMKNKEPNAFGAFDNITRGEFAQMLVKILDIPLDYNPNNMTFDDVLPIDFPDALWNFKYVETAVKKGFIRGKSPRLFFPNDPLTREEASIMIARAFNMVKSNADPDKDLAALKKTFTDGGTIEIYASSAVQAVVKAKYLLGIPNTTPAKTNRFEPNSFLKRADAAVISTKIMKTLKKL